MDWKIPLFKIYWEQDDVQAVTDVIESGSNWATGENIGKWEEELSSLLKVEHAVLFNSGTSALHAMMIAAGIKPGDEVIVPSLSFIATANAPLFVGATPVFAEIEKETYGLDPKDVERKITEKTKAIIPVHYGGNACQIEELAAIATKHNVLLLEDAAESLGATVNGKYVGTFGQAGMFSFCAPKVITTGEGGVIVTNDRAIYEKLKLLRSHGRADTVDYFSTAEYLDYVELGYNTRVSNITAALGRSQLRKLSKIIDLRREKAAYLTELLQDIDEIELPVAKEGNLHLYQMYTIYVKEGEEQREALRKHLNDKGIMAKVYFPPIHLSKFYQGMGYKEGDLPETENIAGSVLTLPMYPTFANKDMDYMAKEIQNFYS